MTKFVLFFSVKADQRKFHVHFSIAFHTEIERRRTMDMWSGILARTCVTNTNLPAKERELARHPASLFLIAIIRKSKLLLQGQPNIRGAFIMVDALH